MIFTHHRFSDALLENQIPEILTDLSAVFHLWTPCCKRFSMDYGAFHLVVRGMERKRGGRRLKG